MISTAIRILMLVVSVYASITTGCSYPTIRRDYSGTLTERYYDISKEVYSCYKIEVPDKKFLRIENVTVYGYRVDVSLKVTALGDGSIYEIKEKYSYYGSDTINVFGDVYIEFITKDVKVKYGERVEAKYSLNYTIDDIFCAQQKNNTFRCSPSSCISKSKVCDRIKDCAGGEDEMNCEIYIVDVEGVTTSRTNAISWLKKEKLGTVSWLKNDQRSVTALYLADGVKDNDEDVNIVKKLELETSVALLRDDMDRVTPNDLALFIQALLVTCRDPRRFYGFDLVKLLKDREEESHQRHESIHPTAILALCNANETVTDRQVKSLIGILNSNAAYAFLLDMQAVALMALSCIKNAGTHQYVDAHINGTVSRFLKLQKPDGRFGNIYTTAYLTQAILSINEKEARNRSVIAAEYLMKQQANDSSFGDFLATYLILPLLNGKTLVDIGKVNCSDKQNKFADYTTLDEEKLSPKINVKYSLYIGDKLDVVESITLRLPPNNTAYQIMEIAAEMYPKYKFDSYYTEEEQYVFSISGIANDPISEKLWIFHLGQSNGHNSTVEIVEESIDNKILEDRDHFIMWYKAQGLNK